LGYGSVELLLGVGVEPTFWIKKQRLWNSMWEQSAHSRDAEFNDKINLGRKQKQKRNLKHLLPTHSVTFIPT
jgi:hypothetical protein